MFTEVIVTLFCLMMTVSFNEKKNFEKGRTGYTGSHFRDETFTK